MPTQSFNLTQQAAQITRNGYSWSAALGAPATVTFAFRDSPVAGQEESSSFSRTTPAQEAAYIQALRLWSDIANITFQGVNLSGYSNNAALLFSNYRVTTGNSAGHAYFPTTKDTTPNSFEGDAWLNLGSSPYTNLNFGS